MIITVGGQKGGTGKTTIATELVIFLSQKGNTLLVDADDQATATDFSNSRTDSLGETGYTTIQLREKALANELPKLINIYDYIIIDAGGYDSISQRYAISLSDKYLVVFKPESFALWTMEAVEEMINLSAAGNPKLKVYSCLNMGWPSGTDNDESAKLLEDSTVFSYLPHVIVRRKAFTDAGGDGLSVYERKPKDEKAQSEIKNLITSLLEN